MPNYSVDKARYAEITKFIENYLKFEARMHSFRVSDATWLKHDTCCNQPLMILRHKDGKLNQDLKRVTKLYVDRSDLAKLEKRAAGRTMYLMHKDFTFMLLAIPSLEVRMLKVKQPASYAIWKSDPEGAFDKIKEELSYAYVFSAVLEWTKYAKALVEVKC